MNANGLQGSVAKAATLYVIPAYYPPLRTQTKWNKQPMNPTWVMQLPRGDEKGAFFTMDMGGTNFRVCKVTLKGTAGKYDVVQMDNKIPKSLKSGTAEQLWHYIADCLQQFVDRYSISQKELAETPLAFTFSYPVTQTSISHGTLQRWTKGFDIKGVEGTDVVAGLQKVLTEKVSTASVPRHKA